MSFCPFFHFFRPKYWSICLHTRWSCYPPRRTTQLEESCKAKKKWQPEIWLGLKNGKIWWFIYYSCVMYCWKAYWNKILKSQKKIDLLHRLLASPKNWPWSLKYRKWVFIKYDCNNSLESLWKGDLKKIKQFWPIPPTSCQTQKSFICPNSSKWSLAY